MPNKWSLVGMVQRDDAETLRTFLSGPEGQKVGQDDLARGLMVAAEKCYEQCAALLLAAGAKVDIHDSSGITPLIAACKQNQVPMVRMLIEAGCNINKAAFRIHATALHWSASLGHFECARLLLEAGAKMETMTIHGRTPLMMACRSDQEDLVDLLLQQAPKPNTTAAASTSAETASTSKSHSTSSASSGSQSGSLLSFVNAMDHERATAMHLAAEEGATDCLRLLIKAGADVNARMKNGDTPIMLAARRGHHCALKLLLRQIPLDLNLRGHQMSALHWAAEGGHVDCAQALLEYGSDPNVLTKDSHHGGLFMVNGHTTPLMLACRGGYSKVAALLIESGAQGDLVDAEGLTALLYSVKKDSAACISVLAASVELDGVWLNFSDGPGGQERGLSPVAQAIRKNKLNALAELLRQGADPNVVIFDDKTDHPMTVFELSLSLLHIDCCRMLLTAGYTVNIINQSVFEDSMATLCAMDEQVFSGLCARLWSTRSLKDLCRMCIRQQMGRGVGKGWKELPLPTVIQSYVNLDELEDLIE